MTKQSWPYSTKRLVIISDLDDVIADTTRTFLKEVNKKFNIESKLQDVLDPELNSFSQKHGVSNKELFEFYTDLLYKEEFTQRIPEVTNASKYLEKIKQLREATDIYIITGRPEKSKYLAQNWLDKKSVTYDKIFLTDMKTETYLDSDKVKTKDELIELLEGKTDTVILEDSPRLIPTTLRGVLTQDKDTLILLYLKAKGIEREVEQNSRISFVRNWDQAYSILNKDLGK